MKSPLQYSNLREWKQKLCLAGAGMALDNTLNIDVAQHEDSICGVI